MKLAAKTERARHRMWETCPQLSLIGALMLSSFSSCAVFWNGLRHVRHFLSGGDSSVIGTLAMVSRKAK